MNGTEYTQLSFNSFRLSFRDVNFDASKNKKPWVRICTLNSVICKIRKLAVEKNFFLEI